MTKQNKYWFKRRRFGYGWVPVTKQGFLLVSGFLLVIVASSFLLELVPDKDMFVASILYLIAVAVLVIVMIIMTRLHGPKPKWRWGVSKKDNPDEDF